MSTKVYMTISQAKNYHIESGCVSVVALKDFGHAYNHIKEFFK